ncbi:MAG: HesA/MoeB/ThiF family protein [Candidatus Woesearchaeota archaeon]
MQYQHLIDALGEDDFSTLQQKTVSVIGLGGIGSCVAELLVRSGISVRVIEKDRVLEEDLDRLSLFEHKHISKFKATEAKKILNKINPEVMVKSFNEEITEQSLFLMDADLVLDCSGDHELTPLISDYCFSKKIPCIAGGVRDNKCIVISSTAKESVLDQLEDLPFEKTEGLLPAMTRITSGFMYVRAVKQLLGKDSSNGLLAYDLWSEELVLSGSSNKKATKKPAKKKSSAKPAGAKKKTPKAASSKKVVGSKKKSSAKKPKK